MRISVTRCVSALLALTIVVAVTGIAASPGAFAQKGKAYEQAKEAAKGERQRDHVYDGRRR